MSANEKRISLDELHIHDHQIKSIRTTEMDIEIVLGLEYGPPAYRLNFTYPHYFCLRYGLVECLDYVQLQNIHPVLDDLQQEHILEKRTEAEFAGVNLEGEIKPLDLYCSEFIMCGKMELPMLTVITEKAEVFQVVNHQ